MKQTVLRYILLFSVLLITVSSNSYSQKITAYDQLRSVNAEWKNQPDIDPALLNMPSKYLAEQQLIQFHLHQTEHLLRKRSTNELTAAQKKNRFANLDVLHSYWQKGIFPVNDRHDGRQPYFIDKFNTYCAVGYLMQQSGADEMARDINRSQNYNYLIDIAHPDLMKWVVNSGLSLDELALIQPAYPGISSAILELHYNNTGTDVNEYIEVHQDVNSGPGTRFKFETVLFYDHLNVLYKTMPISAMQHFTFGYYAYLFPANENFADSGKIELLNNLSETLYTFIYNASGVTAQKRNPLNGSLYSSQTYSTTEDDNTAVGSSLQFCGSYYINSGPAMWQPLINPSSMGVVNPCIILAVKLTDFTYTAQSNSVQLKWQTVSESNSDHFLVERSSDGVNFNSISKINAAGTSNTLKQYSFTDNNPAYLNHYRLKHVNLDGSFSYSQILYVKFPGAKPINIVTNPVNATLKIYISSTTANAGNILVYDLHGHKMHTQKAKTGSMEINVSAFPAGKYLLQLQAADGKAFNLAFIKQ